MKNIFLKIFARLYTAWVHRLERKIGYRLKFTHIPNSWINGWMIFDMTRAWPKHNINAVGVNYFTVGGMENGLSTRFIRNSSQYQSWLGAYLVKFKDDKNFILQDHFNLAVADQKNWLKSFGDKNPFIEMPTTSAGPAQDFSLGNYQGKLYEFFGGPSHSDVGPKSTNLWTKIIMLIMAEVINLSNPNLKLQGNYFLPNNLATEYETVNLKGYIAVIELEKNIKFVLYGNSVEISDANGQKTDHFPKLKEDILLAFKSAVIEKLK